MEHKQHLIIVADDDHFIRELICEILADEGYGVIGCSSGVQAFEVIGREQPDLVVADVWMEERDSGFVLLKKVRQTPALQGIPFIMCAANQLSLRENAQRLEALNCVPLDKPFDVPDLLNTISNIFGLTPV